MQRAATTAPAADTAKPTRRLCEGRNGWQWDLECADMAVAAEAAQACWHCPALARCRSELDTRCPGWGEGLRRRNPRGLVWAGLIFSHKGRLLTRSGLRRSARARAAVERRDGRANRAPEAEVTGVPRQRSAAGPR